MKLNEETLTAIAAISIAILIITIGYGGAIMLENIELRAKLNALETVCKANAIREGAL